MCPRTGSTEEGSGRPADRPGTPDHLWPWSVHCLIPSVLITGDTAPKRLRQTEAGGYRLLYKPVNLPQLHALLEIYRQMSGL
jgi:hypothetical protein